MIISPFELRSIWVDELVALKVPATCNKLAGLVVPMPTLPEVSTNKSPALALPLTFNVPTTCNVCDGDVVFIPTFPELVAK